MPIINDRIITFMVDGRVFTANSVNEFQDFVRRQTGDHTINVADHFPHLQPEVYDDNGNRQDQAERGDT